MTSLGFLVETYLSIVWIVMTIETTRYCPLSPLHIPPLLLETLVRLLFVSTSIAPKTLSILAPFPVTHYLPL